ncbi:peptidase domain-containing ABC transporter [Maritalea sp.]|jgi:ABC-type bacteriocin/lantibiotic exporter with double-glycine peptidase domain|uniref:peptidase domain-containing ABC transporter n=1 Tax=Maritalea sp. TaxID=2003361 RepID=UPI0039E672C7
MTDQNTPHTQNEQANTISGATLAARSRIAAGHGNLADLEAIAYSLTHPQKQVSSKVQLFEDDQDALDLSELEQRLGITDRWPGIDYESSAGRCLQVLLGVMGWAGNDTHLVQALPHFERVSDLPSMRAVLTRLSLAAEKHTIQLSELSDEKLPCIHHGRNGTVSIVLSIDHADNTAILYNGATGKEETYACSGRPQTLYLINPVDIETHIRHINSFGWVTQATASFKNLFMSLFLVNFGINMAALAVPIFIMAIFGYVIPSKSSDSLIMLVVGISLVILAEFALRNLRSKILAYIGARFDSALSVEVFERLLYMPFHFVQSAPIGAQLSRLRQFEKLRELFIGSLGTAILDLPFVLIFITAIAIIGGWLAIIPVALIAMYIILAVITIPMAKRQTMQSGDAKTKKQNIMMELFLSQRDIRNVGGEQIWQTRFEKAAASFGALDFKSQHFSQKVQIISQALSMYAGIIMLGFGTISVINGNLNVGGLIAIMAIVWRILSPLQNAFMSLSRVGRLIEATRLINNLMRMQPERTPGVIPNISRSFDGHIKTNDLSFRYQQATEAAIRGLNIDISPGEIVAITGPSGSGKSTFLKLLAGLYNAQSGSITFDHLDIRQIDLGELRFEISFQQDRPRFFYGSIEQNVKMNDPAIEKVEIERMMAQFNVPLDHPDFDEGLETRLRTETVSKMSDSLKQRLLLVVTFAKQAAYYFLDEPANFIDYETDQKFMAHLTNLRGKSTVLFTTQRPSHMKMADRVIVLHEGRAILNGPPERVMPQLEEFNKKIA